ncbi:MAG: alpha/beta hydrolase [Leptospiraceae bacterium]|nr:alpha/beta hydrolase [Leptospiraceae bacterium]MCP5498210.1 alpha/beta hydrolase [Leptospiraceae bacterium]
MKKLYHIGVHLCLSVVIKKTWVRICSMIGRSLLLALFFVTSVFSETVKSNFQIHIEKSWQYYNTKEYEKTIEELQLATRQTSEPRELSYVYNFMGYAFQTQNDLENAISNYEKALEYDSNNLIATENLGNLYVYFPQDKIRITSALELLLKAETLNTQNYNVYYNIAYIYLLEQKFEESVVYLDKALFYGFDDIAYMAKNLEGLKDTTYYKRLVANRSKLLEAKLLFAKAKEVEMVSDYQAALSNYQLAMDEFLASVGENSLWLATVYYSLGNLYDKKGEYSQAFDYYHKSLKIKMSISGEEYSKVDMGKALNTRIQNSYATTQDISVLYATPRGAKQNSIPSCSNDYFSTNIGKEDRYGVCNVNVPVSHDIGELSVDPADPSKSFSFKNFAYHNRVSFFDSIKEDSFSEVLVFVHGFNVPFEEAALRAAQIKFDLKFPGKIVLFTWPAGAQEGGIVTKVNLHNTYRFNQENAKNSIPYFKSFLQNLKATNKKVHLIVHSMGHQVVVPALAELSKVNQEKIVQELVFNAPDFDLDDFKKASSSLVTMSQRVTVYCSPGDNALLVSSKVNNNKRIGSCSKVSGVDMINVNPIDSPVLQVGGLGHGYYSSRPILTDLYQLILGVETPKRLYIQQSYSNEENYILRR